MKKVRVYFNSRKKNFSIQEKIEGKWRVTDHAETMFLENVSFNVSRSGWKRSIAEKVKNVHAWVVGEPVDTFDPIETTPEGFSIRYDRTVGRFVVNHSNIPIESARRVRLWMKGPYPIVEYV